MIWEILRKRLWKIPQEYPLPAILIVSGVVTWWFDFFHLGWPLFVAAGIILLAMSLDQALDGLDAVRLLTQSRLRKGDWFEWKGPDPEVLERRRRVDRRLITEVAAAIIVFAAAVYIEATPFGGTNPPPDHTPIVQLTRAQIRAALRCQGSGRDDPSSLCAKLDAIGTNVDWLKQHHGSAPSPSTPASPLTRADLQAALQCVGGGRDDPASLCAKLDAMGERVDQIKPTQFSWPTWGELALPLLAFMLGMLVVNSSTLILRVIPSLSEEESKWAVWAAWATAIGTLLLAVFTAVMAFHAPESGRGATMRDSTVNVFPKVEKTLTSIAWHRDRRIVVFFPKNKQSDFPSSEVEHVSRLIDGLRGCGGNASHPIDVKITGFASSAEYNNNPDSDEENLLLANKRARSVAGELLALAGAYRQSPNWLRIAFVQWGDDQYDAMRHQRPVNDKPEKLDHGRSQEVLDRVALIDLRNIRRCSVPGPGGSQ